MFITRLLQTVHTKKHGDGFLCQWPVCCGCINSRSHQKFFLFSICYFFAVGQEGKYFYLFSFSFLRPTNRQYGGLPTLQYIYEAVFLLSKIFKVTGNGGF